MLCVVSATLKSLPRYEIGPQQVFSPPFFKVLTHIRVHITSSEFPLALVPLPPKCQPLIFKVGEHWLNYEMIMVLFYIFCVVLV